MSIGYATNFFHFLLFHSLSLSLSLSLLSLPEVGETDLLVTLEGDVPADHVIQQDAQGPDGGRLPVVA